jgi:hypothetical protein
MGASRRRLSFMLEPNILLIKLKCGVPFYRRPIVRKRKKTKNLVKQVVFDTMGMFWPWNEDDGKWTGVHLLKWRHPGEKNIIRMTIYMPMQYGNPAPKWNPICLESCRRSDKYLRSLWIAEPQTQPEFAFCVRPLRIEPSSVEVDIATTEVCPCACKKTNRAPRRWRLLFVKLKESSSLVLLDSLVRTASLGEASMIWHIWKKNGKAEDSIHIMRGTTRKGFIYRKSAFIFLTSVG